MQPCAQCRAQSTSHIEIIYHFASVAVGENGPNVFQLVFHPRTCFRMIASPHWLSNTTHQKANVTKKTPARWFPTVGGLNFGNFPSLWDGTTNQFPNMLMTKVAAPTAPHPTAQAPVLDRLEAFCAPGGRAGVFGCAVAPNSFTNAGRSLRLGKAGLGPPTLDPVPRTSHPEASVQDHPRSNIQV